MYKIFLFILGLFLSVSAVAKMPPQNNALMNKAANNIVNDYFNLGITGLIINTQDCFEKTPQNLYCIYYGLGAASLDWNVSKEMGFPVNEFWNSPAFFNLPHTLYKSYNMTQNEVKQHVSKTFRIMTDKTYQSFQKKINSQ
ncbi:hypothetical protein [Lonepinella sp. BR2357]|uniref:hypothetical protein n=1 Tax=Lonepinella sp. BR2357 TaxID=3434549 RepID=UPI003F6DD7CF